MALLDQLFGQQPQGDGGMVQNILQQRFAPTPDDASQAAYQTIFSPQPVSSNQVMQQRIAVPLDTATRLAQIQQQGEQARELQMKNQMTQFQMPFLQGQMQDLYGASQPQQPQNGGFMPPAQVPQQNGSMPPVGFPANQNQSSAPDSRLKKAELAAMMGNKPLSEAIMAEYNADPNVISGKETATKEGGNAADAGKTLNVMSANLPVVMQRLQEMEDAVPNASYGLGVNNEGTGLKQQAASQFGYDKNNAILQQRAAQGILPELGPQLAQAGIRGNKFLETLASSASGLNLAASPEAKTAAIQGLREQYISNLKSTARQVRAQGGQAPSDAEIDAQVAQFLKSTGNTTGAPMAKGNSKPSQSMGFDESDPRIIEARKHYTDDEIRAYLQKGQQ